MYKKNIVIEVRAGLCNRLRFLIPLINLINKENNMKNKVIIIWPIDDHCNGFYLDYFRDIKNIVFNKNKKSIKKLINKEKDNISFINNINEKRILSYNEKLNIFDKQFFKLNDTIYNKIKGILKNLSNNYISVHIRRTDLDAHLKYKKIYEQRTTDKDFINFIEKNKKYNLFIATDNLETQELLMKKYSERIKYIKMINDKDKNKRKTNLEDAIIDLFLCICSNKFKGTFYSSFSDFIEMVRNNILMYKEKITNDPIKKLKSFNLK